ncbi:hypothetical protein L21SP5_00079 [Salinivirga cyanobacteriivorans]|uniref:Translocation protein TolB n=1 Tax=Salinivirga cyanobacteriivorans TaxID=1307839 RepID=A0A0S2HUN8_9BACT|nr:hypothetical protein [Salinivirga cyanobacteriivorans]ALO13761.1 hypothetical protein L21SP5_00079 [Salinivirga cyanobacteriivorans]
MKKIIIFIVFISSTILSFSQKYPPPYLYVGFVDSQPVFSELSSKSLISITETDTIIIKKYPELLFPLQVLDNNEVLYNFKNEQYTINTQYKSYQIENVYSSITYDVKNNYLYATVDILDEKHPKEIVRINLETQEKEFLGIVGYVQKVVDNKIFFCLESEPREGNVPWDIYLVDLNKKESAKLIFKRNALINNFAFSKSGKYVYAYNPKVEQIINSETGEKQDIKGPGFSEESPFFSFDNKYLVFYDPYSFRTVKIKIKV